MNISLTPEERKVIQCYIDMDVRVEQAAKSQLKKVGEWGEEICIEHHGSHIYIRRRQCDSCWNELKVDVG